MSGKELSTKWARRRRQRSGGKDAAAFHRGQRFLHWQRPFTFKDNPVCCNTYCCFQRSEEGAESRTSGSVSPADFFSHTPKETPNFQIPVSCGKIPHTISLPTCHCLF